MFKTLKNAWRVPELRRKIIFTLWMFAVIRLGAHIPVPGVNAGALEGLMSGDNNVLGLLDAMSGGAFKSMALFAMGVGPYINASIIMQLLTIAIPKLEELSKDGEDGRKTIDKYTRYVTLALAIIQSWGMTFSLRNYNVLSDTSVWGYSLAVVSFVAGSMLVMWVGEQITEKGLGNGISLIIFINIVSRIPQGAGVLIAYKQPIATVILLLLFLAMIVFVVIMSQGERRIPVQYAKRTTGRRVYGGQSTHIPIKVNLSGVLPVIFAMSMIQFPEIITGFFVASPSGTWGKILSNLKWTEPFGAVLYILLILFFTFFYSTIAFNPVEVASNMKKSGGFVPGIRPGKPTADHLTKIATHVTLMGAIFLAIIATLPVVFTAIFGMQVTFGGTSLLIVVGVALETVKSLESQMLMRTYKGFL
ncbi:MAG TPA: preprotein translocase subunit SecY [Epulopiscium sp.]|nr:preprotein translocase subunit SecY [Candidatus Epulonipiscium sp.]